MSRQWFRYKTYESWSNLLQELLQQANAAIDSGNSADKEAALTELSEFIDNSPMSIPQTKELDEIADAAMDAIWEDTAKQTFQILQKDLSRIQRVIRAAKNDAAKGNLGRRYELLAGVVDNANETIRNATELVGRLKEGKADDLASDVESLIATLQKLRDKVESARG